MRMMQLYGFVLPGGNPADRVTFKEPLRCTCSPDNTKWQNPCSILGSASWL